MENKYKTTKYACYITSMTMSAVSALSPLLFVTFRQMYGISYTLLGLLVVINFATQLLIDLIFSFYSKHFNIAKTVKLTPFVAFFGFIIYAVLPVVFPEKAFLWIAVGTVVFSVSAGLAEVLMSPVIAAIPAKNPEREMSKLHSMYAWGVVGVVIISTAFLRIFGTTNWMYLAFLWSLLPLVAFILYLRAEIPPMDKNEGREKKNSRVNVGLLLCVGCIFFGGASECTMAQWVSDFTESAVGVPKLVGDIIGAAGFAFLLGVGRSYYAKYGKNISRFMLCGIMGATICYFVAGFSLNPIVGLVACALTGLCTAMLWPGTLIYAEENLESMGVAAYAVLAAGGDAGASIAPQLVGIVTDKISAGSFAQSISASLGVTAEQLGMRAGLITAGLFPLAGMILIIYMRYYFSKKENR